MDCIKRTLFFAMIAALILGIPCTRVTAGAGDALNPLPADSGKSFRVVFSLTKGETSKDSHEYRYSFVITENRITYTGPYGECIRGQCEHKKIEFALTPGQYAQLLALLEAESLYKDYSETRASHGLGTWVSGSLMITNEGRSGRIYIEGMLNNWSNRNKPSKLEISARAREQLNKLQHLQYFISNIAKGHFPQYH